MRRTCERGGSPMCVNSGGAEARSRPCEEAANHRVSTGLIHRAKTATTRSRAVRTKIRPIVAKILGLSAGLLLAVSCGEKRGSDMPDFARCADQSGCGPGYACRSGVCISPEGQAETSARCGHDGDCGRGLECVEGKCVADMTGCSDNFQCGFGQVCIDGRCENESESNVCSTSTDCPGGVCINKRCQ